MESTFQLVAGHVALDFVNTLERFAAGGAVEHLGSWEDLLGFSKESGLISPTHARALAQKTPKQEAERVLQAAWELRGGLADIFSAPDRDPGPWAVGTLNRWLQAAWAHRHIRRRNGVYAWALDTAEGIAWTPVWLIALAAAELLTSSQLARVRACASETCRSLFLDTSKNHSRRWCEMKVCGNRIKARRYYARQTGAQ